MKPSGRDSICDATVHGLSRVLPLVALSTCISHVEAASKDTFCGPRCVQRVLEYFGQDEDLLSLVREMQWPVSSSGATLEQLQQALETRGIRTMAVDVPKDAEFQWHDPAIFHLVTQGTPHYVVWLPPKQPGDRPTIWGASYKRIISSDEFLQTRTGVVLLTSRSSIPRDPVVGSRPGNSTYLLCMLFSATSGFVVAFLFTPQRVAHEPQ